MAFGESVTRSGLEIPLKLNRSLVALEPHGDLDFPGEMLGGVRRLTSIVLVEAAIEIVCETYIRLGGIGCTAEEVDVLHGNPPVNVCPSSLLARFASKEATKRILLRSMSTLISLPVKARSA